VAAPVAAKPGAALPPVQTLADAPAVITPKPEAAPRVASVEPERPSVTRTARADREVKRKRRAMRPARYSIREFLALRR